MSDKSVIGGVVVLLLAVGGVLFAVSGGSTGNTNTKTEEPLDLASPVAVFAQCVKDSGAIFYGAFWCPHCDNQKKMFGPADELIPYVECSSPDKKFQLPVCREAKVESYPTWQFTDGSRMTGELSFETLSEKTGCALPGSASAAGGDMSAETSIPTDPSVDPSATQAIPL
jgi:hypothetical protein